MKSAYYYLIASLPMLDFNLGVPLTYQGFLTRCEEQLSAYDLEIIKRTKITPSETTKDSCSILQIWKEFDTVLRNELVRMRATKTGKDVLRYIHGEDEHNPFVAHFAHIIFNQTSPLEAEKQFDLTRWEKIEELKMGHFFDIEFLVCFALQLQILERWNKINQEKGTQILEELVEKA